MRLSEVLAEKGSDVVTARNDESVGAAIQKLVAHNIGALAIVDAANRLVGIFSERDILRLISNTPEALAGFRISDHMTRNVITASLEDNVDESQARMFSNRIRHLPVLNQNGNLIGMISMGDLVKARLDQVEFENNHLEGIVSGKYPA